MPEYVYLLIGAALIIVSTSLLYVLTWLILPGSRSFEDSPRIHKKILLNDQKNSIDIHISTSLTALSHEVKIDEHIVQHTATNVSPVNECDSYENIESESPYTPNIFAIPDLHTLFDVIEHPHDMTVSNDQARIVPHSMVSRSASRRAPPFQNNVFSPPSSRALFSPSGTVLATNPSNGVLSPVPPPDCENENPPEEPSPIHKFFQSSLNPQYPGSFNPSARTTIRTFTCGMHSPQPNPASNNQFNHATNNPNNNILLVSSASSLNQSHDNLDNQYYSSHHSNINFKATSNTNNKFNSTVESMNAQVLKAPPQNKLPIPLKSNSVSSILPTEEHEVLMELQKSKSRQQGSELNRNFDDKYIASDLSKDDGQLNNKRNYETIQITELNAGTTEKKVIAPMHHNDRIPSKNVNLNINVKGISTSGLKNILISPRPGEDEAITHISSQSSAG